MNVRGTSMGLSWDSRWDFYTTSVELSSSHKLDFRGAAMAISTFHGAPVVFSCDFDGTQGRSSEFPWDFHETSMGLLCAGCTLELFPWDSNFPRCFCGIPMELPRIFHGISLGLP